MLVFESKHEKRGSSNENKHFTSHRLRPSCGLVCVSSKVNPPSPPLSFCCDLHMYLLSAIILHGLVSARNDIISHTDTLCKLRSRLQNTHKQLTCSDCHNDLILQLAVSPALLSCPVLPRTIKLRCPCRESMACVLLSRHNSSFFLSCVSLVDR